MDLAIRDIVGIFAGLIMLAGLSVAIVNGNQTAAVLGAGSTGFANMIKAATAGGK